MTNALRLPKSFDDVTEAVLLDEDWYTMRLQKPPQVMPNGALKEWMKDNGVKAKTEEQLYDAAKEAASYQNENGQYAGLNWVLSLKVVHHDPMINGRSFRKYLGIPNTGDAERTTPLGQTVEDSKMESIKTHLEAFAGGKIDGSSDQAELTPGDQAQFYVVKRFSEYSQKD